MAKLKTGITIKTSEGEDIFVQEQLGEGGQGIVYKVQFRGKPMALKWYSKGLGENAEKFYRNLERNVKSGSPAKTFLWPIALTNMDSSTCCGYIMDLRPKEFKDFDMFLLNRVQYKSFSAIVNTALQIVASFRLLHNKGLSYQDLNDGNFFINPENGDVLICDNDNVMAEGENLGIQGKPKYMAPEVVCLNKKPDAFSDRFSLAVILFMLFFKGHPLDGQNDNPATDPAKNEMNLYCKNPVFIFDPKNASNRPDPEIHKNPILFWPYFPSSIRMAFIKAFDKTLMDYDGGAERESRIIEKQWMLELIKLRHQIVTVNGEETFFDPEDEEHIDMNTDKAFVTPPLLKVGKYSCPLQPGRNLYQYEIEDIDVTLEELGNSIGEVIANKNNPGIWGLRNTSDKPWTKLTPGGKQEIVEPGKVVPVARGVKITFPSKEVGEIV